MTVIESLKQNLNKNVLVDEIIVLMEDMQKQGLAKRQGLKSIEPSDLNYDKQYLWRGFINIFK